MQCWGAGGASSGARGAQLAVVAPLLLLLLLGEPSDIRAAPSNGSTPTTTYFATSMSQLEKHHLRDTAKEMFFHAYNAYMENAYPADELQPLSCQPRWRHTRPGRGDIDEALGNFSLTLVDSLDTLVVMGELDEFERAVRLARNVRVDADLVVSVFETNIRVLGGLLSAHVLAEHLRDQMGRMTWYRGELLNTAKELGYRLLPAFNTSTGIPHPRINLLRGMSAPQLAHSRETCTACAGTMVLEFAVLARLTGVPEFEERAHRAMDALWEQRHRGSDLVGTTINVHSGDWVRRDSGVGAGIDSYYEYCLKAYILLGDDRYLSRFNRHYEAVMRYISQGPLLLDVHMHRPQTTARNYMDALLAFWPGLQVLKGDVKSAIETHEMLYQVMQRHNFLPEAFTTDFQVHWGQHLLRPEFVESTYLLYRATADPYYLHAGKKVLKSLQRHAWVPCGFAAVKDVRTGQHEDRLDSFVLAETFKYLYLLFADEDDLILDMDDYVFSTEAHLFPLWMARISTPSENEKPREASLSPPFPDVEFSHSCPNVDHLAVGAFSESVRRPLSNLVEGTCPSRRLRARTITAAQFQPTSAEHRALVQRLGVSMATLADGRMQLLHSAASARSPADAEEGLLFMQEMVELSRQQLEQPENPPRSVSFVWRGGGVSLAAGPAQFGPNLAELPPVSGRLVEASPLRACSQLSPLSPEAERYRGAVVLMERGDCMFVEKARTVQRLGAVAGIVVDNTEGTTADNSPVFAMSGDGTDDVAIPLVFLFGAEGARLRRALHEEDYLVVSLSDGAPAGDAVSVVDHQITGVGTVEVVALETTQDVNNQLTAATSDSASDVTAQTSDDETLDQSPDTMRQVRAWLKEMLHMTDAELETVAGAEYAPLLKDVASLGPQRLAELQRRLKQADVKDSSSGQPAGVVQRLDPNSEPSPSSESDDSRAPSDAEISESDGAQSDSDRAQESEAAGSQCGGGDCSSEGGASVYVGGGDGSDLIIETKPGGDVSSTAQSVKGRATVAGGDSSAVVSEDAHQRRERGADDEDGVASPVRKDEL